jgi:hypothetical protein
MTRSFRCFSFLCWCAAVLASPVVVHAGAATIESDDATPPPGVSAACLLQPGAINTFSFFWTAPEALHTMAWKIPTTSCATCPSGALNLNSVTFRMRWPRVCSATAEVLIVGAKPGVTCPLEPDTLNVLCGPTTQTIARTGTTLNVLHTIPITANCCVSGDAFLLVRFSGLGSCASGGIGAGLAAAQGPCVECDQFVSAFGIFETPVEMCSTDGDNPTWFAIDADCCAGTPNLPESWGSVKTLYR